MQTESILNISNSGNLTEILHLSIDDLLHIKHIDFTSQALLQKYEFSKSEDFEFAVQFVGNLYKKYCQNEINENELVSHFPSEQHEIISSVVNSRKIEIFYHIIKDFNSKNCQLLESFDWNVKWIMGDSNLAAKRKQIATLILNCRDNRENFSEIFFEMNKSKLDLLIEQLQDCHNKLSNES